jgi:hypothetical protein
MPALYDLYVANFVGSISGCRCLNVFGYQNQVAAGSAASLATGLFTGANAIWPAWRAAVSNFYLLDHIFVFNTNDPTDFYLQPVNQIGAIGADCLAPFDAYAFTYQRASRAVRNGGKRLAGISESSQNAGIPTSAERTLLDAVAVVFEHYVTGTGTDAYDPRILRVTYPIPQTVPPTPGTYTSYPIASVVFSKISHQVSRHY